MVYLPFTTYDLPIRTESYQSLHKKDKNRKWLAAFLPFTIYDFCWTNAAL